MNRINELETELSKAKARIAELEKFNAVRPVTVRQLKAEIGEAIGQKLDGGNYHYMATVNRSDLLKIHAWIMARKNA